MDAKPKHRWFRYSLRTLLVFVTLASAGFGWLGYKARQAQSRKAAVEMVQKRGGYVRYDWPIHENWPSLHKLFGDDLLYDVISVVLHDSDVTDSDLVLLKPLGKIERLFLDSTPVSSEGLVHLEQLTELRTLWLSKNIDDKGLVHLKGLTKLEELSLYDSEITDAGLPSLQGLSHLKRLDLRKTLVTVEGCQELRRTLPNLTIER